MAWPASGRSPLRRRGEGAGRSPGVVVHERDLTGDPAEAHALPGPGRLDGGGRGIEARPEGVGVAAAHRIGDGTDR